MNRLFLMGALAALGVLAVPAGAAAAPATTASTCTVAQAKFDNVNVRTAARTSAASVTTLARGVQVSLIHTGSGQCGNNVVRGGSYTTCGGGDLWATVQFVGSDPGHVYYVARSCVSLL